MASKRDYDKAVTKRAARVRDTQLADGTRNRPAAKRAYASRVIDMDIEAKAKAKAKKSAAKRRSK